jgi:hypothetical protein
MVYWEIWLQLDRPKGEAIALASNNNVTVRSILFSRWELEPIVRINRIDCDAFTLREASYCGARNASYVGLIIIPFLT